MCGYYRCYVRNLSLVLDYYQKIKIIEIDLEIFFLFYYYFKIRGLSKFFFGCDGYLYFVGIIIFLIGCLRIVIDFLDLFSIFLIFILFI